MLNLGIEVTLTLDKYLNSINCDMERLVNTTRETKNLLKEYVDYSLNDLMLSTNTTDDVLVKLYKYLNDSIEQMGNDAITAIKYSLEIDDSNLYTLNIYNSNEYIIVVKEADGVLSKADIIKVVLLLMEISWFIFKSCN